MESCCFSKNAEYLYTTNKYRINVRKEKERGIWEMPPWSSEAIAVFGSHTICGSPVHPQCRTDAGPWSPNTVSSSPFTTHITCWSFPGQPHLSEHLSPPTTHPALCPTLFSFSTSLAPGLQLAGTVPCPAPGWRVPGPANQTHHCSRSF